MQALPVKLCPQSQDLVTSSRDSYNQISTSYADLSAFYSYSSI